MNIEQRRFYRAINRRLPAYYRLHKTASRWISDLGTFHVRDHRRNYIVDRFIEDLKGYHDNLRWN